ASGALNDPTSSPSDDIQRELDRMSSSNDVELQLAALKGEIAGVPAAPAIESGAGATETAAPAVSVVKEPAEAKPEEPA
ncbi:MAG: hypothetical protein QOG69_1817, partial [Actinomycetota bacterium]|nr:hypothetical protein [Actinomycetota bacterium]